MRARASRTPPRIVTVRGLEREDNVLYEAEGFYLSAIFSATSDQNYESNSDSQSCRRQCAWNENAGSAGRKSRLTSMRMLQPLSMMQ